MNYMTTHITLNTHSICIPSHYVNSWTQMRGNESPSPPQLMNFFMDNRMCSVIYLELLRKVILMQTLNKPNMQLHLQLEFGCPFIFCSMSACHFSVCVLQQVSGLRGGYKSKHDRCYCTAWSLLWKRGCSTKTGLQAHNPPYKATEQILFICCSFLLLHAHKQAMTLLPLLKDNTVWTEKEQSLILSAKSLRLCDMKKLAMYFKRGHLLQEECKRKGERGCQQKQKWGSWAIRWENMLTNEFRV